MAVKQNNSEGSGSSSASGQDSNAESGQKTLDLARMIEIMELVNARHQQGEMISEADIVQIYKHIVLNLCNVPMPRQASEMKQFKEDISKIGEFLSKVSEANAFSVFLSYIQIVCSVITGPGNPSGTVAIVFQLFPAEWISKAVALILSSTEHATDDAIRKTVNVLCRWLRLCAFCQNLNLWVLAILNRLREQQKYNLLFDIALDVVEPLFLALIIPILRPMIAPVLFHVLSSVKHTPEVFHKIINRVPSVIKQLKNDSMNTEETKKILQRLVDVLSALISHFPGYEDLYKATEEALAEFTPSYDYQAILEYPSWTDTAEIPFSHTNARVGLVNLGNTCYMNSVLQTLVMTKEFSRNILLSTSKSPMLFKIQQLLALMLHSKRPELTPGAVLHATRPPGFLPGFQQDSSEFLGYLLETLHEQEKHFYKHATLKLDEMALASRDNGTDIEVSEGASSSQNYKETFNGSQASQKTTRQTAVEKTFTGKLTTTYKCLSCSGESKNTDTFRDLQLAFPELKSDCATNYSVQDLLDYYCSPEKLCGDNKYFCDKCKKLSDAQRFINFVSAPKNLILTLKHFKYDQKYHMRAKLMHKVFHDENVSIKVYSPDTLTETSSVHYNLYASVVHSGVSMDSGHYYTYASERPDAWFKFNDNVVTTCSISELHNLEPPNTPYILFYQMKSKTCENSNSSPSEASSSNQLIRVDMSDFPNLEELPPHLREFVNKDNLAFKEELRIRKLNISAASRSASTVSKNNRNGGGDNRDNDDEPPSACGGNALNYVNRFIC